MSEADPQVLPRARAEEAAPPPVQAQIGTAEPVPAEKPKRPALRWAIMLSVPLILLALGGYYWLTSGRYVSTDNAYVQQDMVSVAAEVNGPIVEVLVHDNQAVRRGDVLFRIDPRPYQIALAQADAQIAQAEVTVNQAVTHVGETGPDIAGAQDNLRYAEQSFARYQALIDRGFTTRTEFDNARHNVEEARQRLQNARATAANAQSAVRVGGMDNQPAIQAARVARDQAMLNLSRTEVRAPSDGYVTQVDRLQVGGAVVSGVPVVTLVRSNTTYVEANYKETDLTNMVPGQPAEIRLDAYPDVVIRGHVESIGRGTGSQFSLLPAQNANGNWVKVTQRVPVRIAIDGDAGPGRQMIAGLSANISIDTQGDLVRTRVAAPPPATAPPTAR